MSSSFYGKRGVIDFVYLENSWEGREIRIKIMAGRMVQIISTSWASIVLVCVSLVVSIRVIM